MAQVRRDRPRAKTLEERADEAAAVQRRLKEEAAQRRRAAAADNRGSDRQAPAHGRRQTP
jgi:hypothetical protein